MLVGEAATGRRPSSGNPASGSRAAGDPRIEASPRPRRTHDRCRSSPGRAPVIGIGKSKILSGDPAAVVAEIGEVPRGSTGAPTTPALNGVRDRRRPCLYRRRRPLSATLPRRAEARSPLRTNDDRRSAPAWLVSLRFDRPDYGRGPTRRQPPAAADEGAPALGGAKGPARRRSSPANLRRHAARTGRRTPADATRHASAASEAPRASRPPTVLAQMESVAGATGHGAAPSSAMGRYGSGRPTRWASHHTPPVPGRKAGRSDACEIAIPPRISRADGAWGALAARSSSLPRWAAAGRFEGLNRAARAG